MNNREEVVDVIRITNTVEHSRIYHTPSLVCVTSLAKAFESDATTEGGAKGFVKRDYTDIRRCRPYVRV